MDSLGEKVKQKLHEYGYKIYNIHPTKNKDEYQFMTDKMIVFSNGSDMTITISFDSRLTPEKVAQSMMILNELKELKGVYITESYYLDKEHKVYEIGEKAEKLAIKELTDMALREMAKDQIYSHILATQKCHEC